MCSVLLGDVAMENREAEEVLALKWLAFLLLTLAIGAASGLGAVAFRGLIAFFHNGLLLGQFSIVYDSNVHTPPSPWGPFVILVPVVGAVCVAFLVKNFAPEAKGHGVPEVMDAVHYNRGKIRPIVAVVKSLASAISIGSGGSIGREGPIVQIGSAAGSALGQLMPMATWQRVTLVAAGAGGGIAATFNTPMGGVLFAAELLLKEISARTIVPVIFATVTATYISQYIMGDYPSFVVPAFETPSFEITAPWVVVACIGLGVLTGILSTVFIRSIYATEDFFDERIKGSYYTRHMLGMLLVGVVLYAMMRTTGHYYVEGVGYATVQDILTGRMTAFSFLVLLLFLKLVVTSVTLGSGASGGIFSPSLFLGATLGAAYGGIARLIIPSLGVNIPGFAVAGMAASVAGTTGAVLTAIVMVAEMTMDYSAIIPIMLTAAIAYGIRRALLRESIYTMKLTRRGHFIPEALERHLGNGAVKEVSLTPSREPSASCRRSDANKED